MDVWCTSCGCLMKLRSGKFGSFYGCTGYPLCRATKNLRQVQAEEFEDPSNEELDMIRYDR